MARDLLIFMGMKQKIVTLRLTQETASLLLHSLRDFANVVEERLNTDTYTDGDQFPEELRWAAAYIEQEWRRSFTQE